MYTNRVEIQVKSRMHHKVFFCSPIFYFLHLLLSPVLVGEGVGGLRSEADPRYLEVQRLGAKAVEAGGGQPVLDADLVDGHVDDLDVALGDECLWGVEGGVAVHG